MNKPCTGTHPDYREPNQATIDRLMNCSKCKGGAGDCPYICDCECHIASEPDPRIAYAEEAKKELRLAIKRRA